MQHAQLEKHVEQTHGVSAKIVKRLRKGLNSKERKVNLKLCPICNGKYMENVEGVPVHTRVQLKRRNQLKKVR